MGWQCPTSLFAPIFVILLSSAVGRASINPSCDCTYFGGGMAGGKGGCRIVISPPEGWKCFCERGWSWKGTCRGTTVKCSVGENCPQNCASKECCQSGGGNCKGYPPSGGAAKRFKLSTMGSKQSMDDFRKCLANDNLHSDYLVEPISNSTFYDILNLQWNTRWTKVTPPAYFLPQTTAHVQSAVRCGVQSGMHLIPNSGGHSYEGFSFGTGAQVIVDFRLMHNIQVHAQNLTVTLEPGALVGSVLLKLYQEGGYAIPVGLCWTVAVGGHALGGGESVYSSMYGNTLDNVLEMTIVDATGRALTANSKENSDLFWAFRGVGPSYFGIVTQFKVKMFDTKVINTSFVNLHYEVKHFAKVMAAYQKWTKWVDDNDPKFMAALQIVPDNKTSIIPSFLPGLNVHLLHIQDPVLNPHGNETFLAALKDFFPTEGCTRIEMYNFPHIQFMTFISYTPIVYNGKIFTSLAQPGSPPMSAITKDMALPRYHTHKSMYVKGRNFTDAQFESLGTVFNKWPKDYGITVMVTPNRGAVADVGKADTAFVHRETVYELLIEFETIDPAQERIGAAWVNEFFNAAQFMDGGETYQGVPDVDLRDYLQRYYGTNLPQLKSIKRKWDPNDYFNQQQSMPLA